MKKTTFKSDKGIRITKIELNDKDIAIQTSKTKLSKKERERLWYMDGVQRCFNN